MTAPRIPRSGTCKSARAFALAGVVACLTPFAGQQAGAQGASACAKQPTCMELRKFVVTVADFQTSKQGPTRLLTATVSFRNTSARPIILGYLNGSGIATDDQGNRYVVYGAGSVRGMGEITAREFDPKFVLQPGESSEARFEFAWRPTGREIYGTAYDLDLAVREIDPVAANQLRLGLEHALRFRRLNSSIVAAAAGAIPRGETTTGAATTTATPTVATAITAAIADACGAMPRCFSAGPFTADIVHLTPSKVPRHHVIQINVRFRNVSSAPIILAYTAKSSGAIDNYGNRYHWGRPSTYDTSVQGMGIVQGRNADPQFVLQPGQSRNATFSLIRYEVGRNPIGTGFTYDLAVEQLQVLPSQQVQSVRQYSLHFSSLGANGVGQLPSP